jgi:ribosomal protein L16/L10AE
MVRVQARGSTLDQPSRTPYRKYFKGRVRSMVPRAQLDFGSVGLQSLEVARITAKQMLAIRMVGLLSSSDILP